MEWDVHGEDSYPPKESSLKILFPRGPIGLSALFSTYCGDKLDRELCIKLNFRFTLKSIKSSSLFVPASVRNS